MNCEICNNQRLIKKGGTITRCECVRMMNMKKATQWSEMPKPYSDNEGYIKFTEDLEDRNIRLKRTGKPDLDVKLKDELSFLSQNKKTLIDDNYRIFLQGKNGHGKTQMALTLALEVLRSMEIHKQHYEMELFYYLKPINLVNENRLFNETKRETINEKIKNASVLILDDLGEELELGADDKRKQEIFKLLTYILDHFHGLLIITSNMAYEDTVALFEDKQKGNPRLASRLFTTESASVYTFPVKDGEDMRKKRTSVSKNVLENR